MTKTHVMGGLIALIGSSLLASCGGGATAPNPTPATPPTNVAAKQDLAPAIMSPEVKKFHEGVLKTAPNLKAVEVLNRVACQPIPEIQKEISKEGLRLTGSYEAELNRPVFLGEAADTFVGYCAKGNRVTAILAQ